MKGDEYMNLKGKNVIVLGERDGVQGESIVKCLESIGAKIAMEFTSCFVWTAAGALDLDGQEQIKNAADRFGTDNLIGILGTPTLESSRLFATTITDGDPTWAGPLAGSGLNIPVYHIIESDIADQISEDIYDEEIGLFDLALEGKIDIVAALEEIRDGIVPS